MSASDSRRTEDEIKKISSTSTTSVKMFLIFCAFRVVNVFFIQSQFDPDEYWQQLEPAYCRVFVGAGKPCPGLTWEWKRRPPSIDINLPSDFAEVGMKGPLRSYASILPTLLFYYAIKFFGLDSPWAVARGPVFLNAILVAAPTDWSVWNLSQWMSPQSTNKDHIASVARWCVFCALSSWFCAYALVRTYSNSLETLLLMISLCLVAPELMGDSKVNSPRNLPRACLAFFIGGVSCSIRFTSLAGFLPMGFLLSWRKLWTRSALSALLYVMCVCAVYGLVGIMATMVFDSRMYGFTAVPILANIDFNMLQGNGRLYGTLPFYWYLIAGVPAIAGFLVIFLLCDLACWKTWSRARRNLWWICGSYILSHSFSEHKELRFLLPILPLFCLLCGARARSAFTEPSWYRPILRFAAVLQVIIFLYLGLFHQRASIEVNRRIVELVKHEPQTYSIHYLMGCHSTPLLSHLHSPPIHFEPWTLDCSPSCRGDPKAICESDLFARDPGKFMEDTYFHCSDFEEGACVTDLRIFYPDFLVARAGDIPAMQSRIATIGMNEVGRFKDGINGLRVANTYVFGSDAFAKNSYSTLSLLGDSLVVSFDEFVLFENREINPRY